MKRLIVGACAVAFALGSAAWGQDAPPRPGDKYRPEAPHEDEVEPFSPEEAMALLNEVRDLMKSSEELLYTSARGRVLETEKGILRRIETLLGKDPKAAQKKILEKIERLLGKTEGNQKESVDKIDEIIKRARD